MTDELLKKQKGFNIEEYKFIDFYKKGFEQLSVNQSQIKKIGELIHEMSNIKLINLNHKKFPEKGVANDHHRHIQGAIFAYGSEEYNLEWREHTSSSIREMLSLFASSKDDFFKAYNEKDVKIENDLLTIFFKIKLYYQFFTGVTHHQTDKTIYNYRQLEKIDASQNECLDSENFKKVFRHFFIDMVKILNHYESIN